jgi:hypothetical protein
MNPLQAVSLQGQRREKGRPGTERMHCGSKVMKESRQRQFHGARCTTRRRFRFEHIYLQSRLG